MDKRLEGRDELILDPDLPIIDAHHHLYVRPGQRYLVDDYLADAGAGHRIAASVYVETLAFARDDGPEALRPLPEVEFANGVGAMTAGGAFGPAKVCAAIVGHADMRLGDGIGRLLDRCLETAPERFRGVRQVTLEHASDAPFRFMNAKPPPGILSHPEFGDALRQVARRGLVFDASVFHHQLPALCSIADAHPGATIALNHMGIALGFGLDHAGRGYVLGAWASMLQDVARRPNVVCKVSGIGLPFWGFGFEARTDEVGYRELADAWRPYVETAIEAFGPDRCMAGSDFPPDGRSCGFVPLWNALKNVTASLSSSERSALFHGTAARVYRIATPWIPSSGSR